MATSQEQRAQNEHGLASTLVSDLPASTAGIKINTSGFNQPLWRLGSCLPGLTVHEVFSSAAFQVFPLWCITFVSRVRAQGAGQRPERCEVGAPRTMSC